MIVRFKARLLKHGIRKFNTNNKLKIDLSMSSWLYEIILLLYVNHDMFFQTLPMYQNAHIHKMFCAHHNCMIYKMNENGSYNDMKINYCIIQSITATHYNLFVIKK